MIICKGNELALRADNIKEFKNSSISGASPNPQDISQLWLVDHTRDNFSEVVNALSDFCLDEQNGEFKLMKPKWSNSQLISIEKSEVQEYFEYFWIRLGKSKTAASLEGVLRNKMLDKNDASQLFRFEPVGDNNSILYNTVIMENPTCFKVIDVPEASMEGGVRLIQWKKNGRFNQRWKFIKTGNAYQIRSFKSGLNLDINQESKKPGAKIIQWDPSGSSNQLWTLESKTDNLYIIRSVHAPDLMLGVEDNSKEDGGKITTVTQPFPWKLDGPMFNK